MYNEIITEHFMNPRNIGELDHPDHIVKIGNSICGDTIVLHVRYAAEGRIADVKFKAYGCATSIATASVFSAYIINKTDSELLGISRSEMELLLGELEPSQMHCLDIMAELFDGLDRTMDNKDVNV